MRVVMPGRFVERNVGGNSTYARRIASGLTERGIDVATIPAARSAPGNILRETFAGLASARTSDEVVHFVGDTGPLLKVTRPCVVTVHGVASRWIDVARKPWQEKVWRARVARAISAADHVITVSRSSANDVAEVFGVPEDRLTTIEHGLDLQLFEKSMELSPHLRAQLPDSFALYLGNIEPRKNLIELIKAFDTPQVRALGVPLVIAGKPAWNANDTMAEIGRARNTMYVGFVSDEDRAALMQKSAVFVFPSLYEGFGFPVVEALAAGTVVLTSDRGSLAEVAGPSLRLSQLDAEGIAEGVLRALTDDDARRACVSTGRSWAARFDWDTSVEKHIAVYQGVLN